MLEAWSKVGEKTNIRVTQGSGECTFFSTEMKQQLLSYV